MLGNLENMLGNLEDAHLWATRHLNNRPCPVKCRMTAKASADPNPLAPAKAEAGPDPSAKAPALGEGLGVR